MSDQSVAVVRMRGWQPGLQKVSLALLIKESRAVDLARAKAWVDVLLEGLSVTFGFPSYATAERFAEAAREIGAEATWSPIFPEEA